MNCINHPDREATTRCILCGKSLCSECLRGIEGRNYCQDCAPRASVSLKAGEPKKGWSCWLKGCAIGCGGLIILFLIILALFWANRERIKEGVSKAMVTVKVETIEQVENEVIANLPKGFEREQVQKVFDDLEQMAQDRQLSFTDFSDFINECQEVMRDGEVDERELRRLLDEAKYIIEGGGTQQ